MLHVRFVESNKRAPSYNDVIWNDGCCCWLLCFFLLSSTYILVHTNVPKRRVKSEWEMTNFFLYQHRGEWERKRNTYKTANKRTSQRIYREHRQLCAVYVKRVWLTHILMLNASMCVHCSSKSLCMPRCWLTFRDAFKCMGNGLVEFSAQRIEMTRSARSLQHSQYSK